MTEEPDARRVPAREGHSAVREKASRFLGVAARASSPSAAESLLDALRRRHHDATHVAFAWKIGAGAALSRRRSDAGEPAGTAGAPIASAIEASGLTDVLTAVVRYFGGTRLGTGGLARAYRRAAEEAIEAGGSETVYDTARVAVRCAFGRVGAVRRLIRPPEVRLVEERFDEKAEIVVEVRRSRLEPLLARLEEQRLDYRIGD